MQITRSSQHLQQKYVESGIIDGNVENNTLDTVGAMDPVAAELNPSEMSISSIPTEALHTNASSGSSPAQNAMSSENSSEKKIEELQKTPIDNVLAEIDLYKRAEKLLEWGLTSMSFPKEIIDSSAICGSDADRNLTFLSYLFLEHPSNGPTLDHAGQGAGALPKQAWDTIHQDVPYCFHGSTGHDGHHDKPMFKLARVLSCVMARTDSLGQLRTGS